MNALLESLNVDSTAWAAWIWRVSWQAAIVIAIAWLLTLVLRYGSPRWRSWIWRLAYLKLLILLAWTTPITLAMLPPAKEVVSGRWPAGSTEGSIVTNHASDAAELISPIPQMSRDPKASVEPELVAADMQDAAAGLTSSFPANQGGIRHLASNRESVNPTLQLTISSVLFPVWLMGSICVVAWFVRDTLAVARLRRSARRIDRPELNDLVHDVCQQLGLRPRVQIAESHQAGGPMLVKLLTPVVVFPNDMLPAAPSPQSFSVEKEGVEPLNSEEIRLVLAHELAHIMRHDLAWNALAAIVHVLLYFHPFVWFAHRLARQEQEMACDELVVTRLGVQRYQYGQMLLKIVKQLNLMPSPRVAAAAVAGSLHTLSRRLEAMKHIQQVSRRQIVLAGIALALVGATAVIPWRVVAQEAKKGSAAAPSPQPSPVKGEGTGAAHPGPLPEGEGAAIHPAESIGGKQSRTIEDLLVGTWRGGNGGGKLTLRKDGTFYEFPTNLSCINTGISPTASLQGTWRVKNDELMLLWNEDAPVAWPTGEMRIVKSERDQKLKIARLDESFLRLTRFDPSEKEFDTQFYRRLGDVTSLEHLKDKVPTDVLRVAELALMDSEEALRLAEWANAPEFARSLAIIQRAAAAMNGKASLKELFAFTDSEDKAASELKKLNGGSLMAASGLATQGLLAADEESALKKMDAVLRDLANLIDLNGIGAAPPAAVFGAAPVGLPAAGGAVDPNQANDWRTDQETKTKLNGLLNEINSWLSSEVSAGANQPGGGVAIESGMMMNPSGYAPPMRGRGDHDAPGTRVPRPDPRAPGLR